MNTLRISSTVCFALSFRDTGDIIASSSDMLFKSFSIALSIPGYCTFTATASPPLVTAPPPAAPTPAPTADPTGAPPNATPAAPAGHPLVGTWAVVEDGDPAAAPGLVAFAAEGVVVVVSPDGRTALGTWAATGPRTAVATWVYLGEIEVGIPGSGVVRVAVEVAAAGDALAAAYGLTAVTAGGAAAEASEGTVRGRRLPVEGPGATGRPLAGFPAATPAP